MVLVETSLCSESSPTTNYSNKFFYYTNNNNSAGCTFNITRWSTPVDTIVVLVYEPEIN